MQTQEDKELIKQMADGRPYKGYIILDDEMRKIEIPNLFIMLKQGMISGESSEPGWVIRGTIKKKDLKVSLQYCNDDLEDEKTIYMWGKLSADYKKITGSWGY
jgi:hypothetical protein